MDGAKAMRQLLEEPGMLIVPGVHDGLSAQMARLAGFESIFLGSYAITASAFGMPDAGIVPVAQLVEAYRPLVECSGLPSICDIDDGGGTRLQIARNLQLVERAGIGGIQMEDLDLSVGKYLPGRKKRLLPAEQMVDHIKAAADARVDGNLVIMARCDARDASTLDDACERVAAYGEAGADLILVPFLEIEEIPRIRAATATPIAHMFIPSDVKDATSVERVRELGVKYLMYPVLSVWAAGRAIHDAMMELRDCRSDATRAHGGATWQLVNEAMRSDYWGNLA
ncbi:isocitrate lyase/PEP mutase family protein [Sphingobium mellinum]|uniref:isocitrate lyase/PEP mutase family protein n=1 Tax=Sphingobium mellinum TaxID=1387166 RepID=UPI0030EF42E9